MALCQTKISSIKGLNRKNEMIGINVKERKAGVERIRGRKEELEERLMKET